MYASFYQLTLKNTTFIDCNLTEVDFAECQLQQSSFTESNLNMAQFQHANIEKADFRTAYNYSIILNETKTDGAKFSKEEIHGLLTEYNYYY